MVQLSSEDVDEFHESPGCNTIRRELQYIVQSQWGIWFSVIHLKTYPILELELWVDQI